jgi:DNA-binding response OmpR family regulator
MTDQLSQATKSTIMVVDDDQHMATLLRARLEQREFNVMCAYSGLQALADLEKQKPDLILLDVMMPEMDGFEVLRRLKAATESSSIPVILLSARDQLKDISKGYEIGADHYITKPFTNTHLMTVIDHLLNRDKRHSVE